MQVLRSVYLRGFESRFELYGKFESEGRERCLRLTFMGGARSFGVRGRVSGVGFKSSGRKRVNLESSGGLGLKVNAG